MNGLEHPIGVFSRSDQGLDFSQHIENVCKYYKIRRIQSGPFHLQSKSNVEGSLGRLRGKMMYDLHTMKGKGINWAKNRCQATAESSTKKSKKNLVGHAPLQFTMSEN